MADVKKAVEFMLCQEDARLTGEITTIPGDRGGLTRFGLTAKWHPELIARGFFTTMPGWAAIDVAEVTYQSEYERPLRLIDLTGQQVATALLSFAVNDGRTVAVRLLQEAANVQPDGVMGKQTIAAANGFCQAKLLENFCALQKGHYERLAAASPAQNRFLRGWLARVQAAESLA